SAATSKQIDNSISGRNGYGYQIWMEGDNGFAFRGMGSQFALCFPEQDLIFACISDTQGAGPTGTGIIDTFYEEIYSKIEGVSLSEDDEAHTLLIEKGKDLQILPQRGSVKSSFEQNVNGKWYELNDNP